MLAQFPILGRSRIDVPLAPRRRNPLRTTDRLFHRIEICPARHLPADPSVFDELGELESHGSFAEVAHQLPHAADDVHAFDWLRSTLEPATPDRIHAAQRLTLQWIAETADHPMVCWQPSVVARRILAWLSEADHLIDGLSAEDATAVAVAWDSDLLMLRRWLADTAATSRSAGPAIAVTAALCCTLGPGSELHGAEVHLADALAGSLGPQGLHASHGPSATLELAIQLAMLRSLYVARGLTPPDVIGKTAERLATALRVVSLGDGRLARFCQGEWAGRPHQLLRMVDPARPRVAVDSCDGFYRLEAGGMVLVLDGVEEQRSAASSSRESTLAFEISAGPRAILLNPPPPLKPDAAASAAARYNGLLIEPSSGHIVERRQQTATANVQSSSSGSDDGDGACLDCSQEIECGPLRLLHRRRMTLSRHGDVFEGCDTLENVVTDTSTPSPGYHAAVVFHLAEGISFAVGGTPHRLDLKLPDGEAWRFETEAEAIDIDTVAGTADTGLPRSVLRLRVSLPTGPGAAVSWRLKKVTDAPALRPTSPQSDGDALVGPSPVGSREAAATLPPSPRLRTLREALARVMTAPNLSRTPDDRTD